MKYLFASIPVIGHALPMIQVGRELRNRGHEVAFLSGTGLERIISEAGLKFIGVNRTSVHRQRDLFNGMTSLVEGDEETVIMNRIISLMTETYSETLRKVRENMPNVLFIDSATYAPAAVARELGIKWATSSAFPSMIPTKTAPPFTGKMILPADTEEGQRNITRLCDEAEKKLGDVFDDRINSFLSHHGGIVKSPAICNANLSPDLIISYSAIEFEYPRKDWPKQLRLVGPGNWDMKTQASVQLKLPLIYVTLGTFWSEHHSKIFEVILEGLKERKENVLVTTGFELEGHRLQEYKSDRIQLAQYVPNSKIIPMTNLVIHHGGFGTTMGTLLAGKPSLVLPIDTAQHENAARIKYRGIGDYILRSELSPKGIQDKVAMLLSDPQIGCAVKTMKENLAQYDAMSAAANLLEAFSK